jgi:hypothetical protein
MYLFIKGVIKQSAVIIEAYHSYSNTCELLTNILLSRVTDLPSSMWISTSQVNYTHTHAHTHTHSIRHTLEKKSNYKEVVHQLFITNNFEKAYNSGMREVLYRILTAFCVPKKTITLIKVC